METTITANLMRMKANQFNNEGKIKEIEEGIFSIAARGGYNYGCRVESPDTDVNAIVKYFEDNGFKVECKDQRVGYYLTIEW